MKLAWFLVGGCGLPVHFAQPRQVSEQPQEPDWSEVPVEEAFAALAELVVVELQSRVKVQASASGTRWTLWEAGPRTILGAEDYGGLSSHQDGANLSLLR